MKYLKTFNESVRDKMTPKSREEIERIMNDYKKTGDVHIYEELIGKIATNIEVYQDDEKIQDSIVFTFDNGEEYTMYHQDDCCEVVNLEDVNGDIEDLIGAPLLMAEEIISDHPGASESATWTFYKFATIKGYVDIRWYGTSNGYYCETATIQKTN